MLYLLFATVQPKERQPGVVGEGVDWHPKADIHVPSKGHSTGALKVSE